MGQREQCAEWYKQFLEKLGIENDGQYHTFATPDASYEMPEKMQFIRVEEQKVLIGLTVDNARVLLGRLEAGRDITLKNIRKEIAEDSQYQMNERVMGVMCTYVMKHCGHYFEDVMRHLCQDIGFTPEGFNELADLVHWYLCSAEEVCGGTAQDYADGTDRIEQGAQEKRARMDQQTAIDIANAPRYVHIEGRIKDGFFGPKFEGSVTSTSTMSQADVFRAYDNNRSSAWYDALQDKRALGRHLVEQLLNDTCGLVKLYHNDILTFLSKYAPKRFNLPTLLEDTYWTRPYTFPHLLEIIEHIDPAKLKHLIVLADYYKINIDRYMPEHLGKQFTAHYDRHGNCRYDGKDLRFYLLYKDMNGDDIWDEIWLHRVFQGYFTRKVQARYDQLVQAPKLEDGIRPDTPATQYFGDILEEAERCVCVSPRGIRMTTEKAAELTAKLYESRPKKFMSSTRY
ncbi:MAG: hypothetical protein E7541_05725 [Ruminococcaceae bacterium]|nr:hypothetical protein [Oscillospiraceae bacterium]